MFSLNERVKYNGRFLRRTQADYETCAMRGTVVEIINRPPFPRVRVLWDGEQEPRTCDVRNLTPLKPGAPVP